MIAVAVAALAAVAACTAPESPAPDGSAPPSPQAACLLKQVALTKGAAPAEQVLTAVRRIKVADTAEYENTVLIDQPVVPAVTLTGPGPDTRAVLEALALQHGDAVAAAPHQGLPSVDAFLSGIERKPGTLLGYAAVLRQSHGVTATCADGRSFTGTVTSWAMPDIGAVRCGLTLGADAPAVAVRVQREYC
ncbi:hypothetical protein GCM10009662_81490 [Catellatospora coxensis]|uniref:Uncharacterized protein n=2 Tax=Catellatospora coxensis TaxID=310354 RepID=A0A8J3L3S7_9ACTN|nr:hypothetical protein Cco03nite_76040 [Catellatospora coxensis]